MNRECEDIRNEKRVLVTGGTGFVGFGLLKSLPDNVDAHFLGKDAYESLIWTKICWDYIIHLAPVSPVHVINYSKNHKTKVLFASSGAVYEMHSEYAYNKIKWEKEFFNSNISYVIARLFAFIGPDLKNRYAITNFIDDAKHNRPITILGNGTTVRSYLYEDELGTWLWNLLFNGNGIYDVGSSIPYTILEVAKLVSDIIPSEIKILNNPDIPNTIYLPWSNRAENELRCVQNINLKEAIERTINDSK
jgi:nucleoside-diphosphate-sugar epimerase